MRENRETKDILNIYEEIAEYMEEYEIAKRVRGIGDAVDSNRYILSFMGQFSAGKSRLINCLLKRDILPVHITETTAVVTWIQYDEYESARVKLTDGSSRKIEIGEIKNLWQKGKFPDGLSMMDIESIEVCLDSDILKNGLVLADTPGINTLVKRHEALALELLSSTEEIIYVMAKPVTSEDMIYIRNMVHNGIPVSFVRTHMDALNSCEEEAAESMRTETESLRGIAEDARVFFVSAEESSRFYSAINDLREYLGQTLAANVSVRLARSCESRMEVIGEELSARIQEMLGDLTKVKNREKTDCENKAGALSLKINAMESGLEQRRQKIRNGFANAKKDAKENVKQCANILKNSFDRYLEQMTMTEGYEEEIQTEARKRITEAGPKVREAYNRAFDEFIRGSSTEILNEAAVMEVDVSRMPLPQNVDDLVRERMENDMSRRELRSQIQEMEDLIRQLNEELEGMDLKGEDYADAKKALEEAIQEVKREEESLGAYVPQYYLDDSDVKGIGDKMRKMGSVLDWATFFIPGKAYVAAAEKIGKCGVKAVKVASKVLKAAGKADKFKDFIHLLRNVGNVRVLNKDVEEAKNYVLDMGGKVKEKAGILDILTIEYWMGVVGDKLDGKPVKREDLEYRNEYEKEKQAIALKMQEQMRKQLELKEQYGLIKDRQMRAQEEQKIKEEQRQSLERELVAREASIREKAKGKAFATYKEDCSRWFAGIVEEMTSDKVIREMEENAAVIGIQYEEKCTGGLVNELRLVAQNYNELADKMKALDSDELQDKIQIYTGYLQKLGA